MSLEIKKWYKWILFIAGFLLYANTLNHEFTQDDAIVITQNQFTKSGLKGLGPIFSNDTFLGFFGDNDKMNLVAGGRYRPLSLGVFALEYAIFGENTFVFHLVNVLCYGLLLVVIFNFMNLVFKDKIRDAQAWAFVATLIFAFHPIHTEAVANVKGLDEILAMLFGLLSLLIVFRSPGNTRVQLSAAFIYFLALLSKESAATMVGIGGLLVWFLNGQSFRQGIQVIAPMLVALIVFVALRAGILGQAGYGQINELLNNPFLKNENGTIVPFTFSEKFGTVAIVLIKYLQLLVFPHPLTNDYYPHFFERTTLANPIAILSALLYFGLIYFAIAQRKVRPITSFAILYFIITLSIYSNVIFPIGTFMSERFLFSPSLGYTIILAILMKFIYEKNRKLCIGVLGMILMFFAIKTIARNSVWKDNFTLFTTDVVVSEMSAKAQIAAGGSLMDKGKALPEGEQKNRMLTEAAIHIDKGLELYPEYKLAHELKSSILIHQQKYGEAITQLEKSLVLYPNDENLSKNLGVSYREWGKFQGEKIGDLNKSLEYLLKAEAYLSNDPETFRLIAVCSGIQGNHQRAIEYFKRSLSLDEKNAGTWMNLAKAYEYSGQLDLARQSMAQARLLDPNIGK